MPLSLPATLPLLSPVATAAVVLIFSGLLTSSLSADVIFPNCNRNVTCGSLQDITYPFTGGDRPDYCGPPEFRLTCRNNDYAELTINSVTYRVLQINQTQQTLVLASSDLWNNTCPQRFVNSTLNSIVFSDGVQNENLTLVYGCPSLRNYTPYNLFSCIVSGVNTSDAFYLVGPVPVDPILEIITTCHLTVRVPVIGDAARRLTGNQTTLAETLMKGFSVNYRNPYANHCSNCTVIGGQCGFDPNSSQPTCICSNLPCPIGIQENYLLLKY